MLGGTKLSWFTNGWLATAIIVTPKRGNGRGTTTVIILAGLQNIPGELYEAASIDGATRWQQFGRITIPQLKKHPDPGDGHLRKRRRADCLPSPTSSPTAGPTNSTLTTIALPV
jgi:hypothetical protein